LIPALAILAGGLAMFYAVIRMRGGSGERTDGRTLFDKPEEGPPEPE
jgi:hypothetical protein